MHSFLLLIIKVTFSQNIFQVTTAFYQREIAYMCYCHALLSTLMDKHQDDPTVLGSLKYLQQLCVRKTSRIFADVKYASNTIETFFSPIHTGKTTGTFSPRSDFHKILGFKNLEFLYYSYLSNKHGEM